MKSRFQMLWYKFVLSDDFFIPTNLILFWVVSITLSGFTTIGILYIIYSKLFWYNIVIFLIVLCAIGILSPLLEERIEEYQRKTKPRIIEEMKEREVIAEKQREYMKEQEVKKETRKLLV